MTDQLLDAPVEAGAESAAEGAAALIYDKAEDQAPAEEAAPTEADTKTDDGAENPAPVVYEPFVLPQGVEVDQGALDAAQTLFAEARLSQPQAQKLVDLYAGKMNELAQRQIEAVERRQIAWVAEVKNDPELGGTRFETARASARKALTRFGTPELRRSLDELGVGNNPQLFRFFVQVGRSISEDTFAGARSTVAPRSAAETLYPPGTSSNN
jgi:hypothetical protein